MRIWCALCLKEYIGSPHAVIYSNRRSTTNRRKILQEDWRSFSPRRRESSKRIKWSNGWLISTRDGLYTLKPSTTLAILLELVEPCRSPPVAILLESCFTKPSCYLLFSSKISWFIVDWSNFARFLVPEYCNLVIFSFNLWFSLFKARLASS